MQLYNFMIQLINYYPPEYVSLYLLIGLGIVWARLSSASKTNFKVISPIGIVIGFPFAVLLGIVLGILNIMLWPAIFVGVIFNKISK